MLKTCLIYCQKWILKEHTMSHQLSKERSFLHMLTHLYKLGLEWSVQRNAVGGSGGEHRTAASCTTTLCFRSYCSWDSPSAAGAAGTECELRESHSSLLLLVGQIAAWRKHRREKERAHQQWRCLYSADLESGALLVVSDNTEIKVKLNNQVFSSVWEKNERLTTFGHHLNPANKEPQLC